MSEVHQFLPSLGFRDAVANHTLRLQQALSDAGLGGAVWAEDIHPEVAKRARQHERYERLRSAKAGHNLLLYQASTGSRGMVEDLLARPEAKTLYFHNITPASFFEPYDPGAAMNLARGRDELKALCARVRRAGANSEYSARELRELGVEQVDVLPLYLPATVSTAADPTMLSWLRQTKRGADVLFVSRCAPHKGHLHLLRAFAAMRAAVDPGARLFVVGSWGPEAYMRAIFALRERVGADGISFTGSITEANLAALYAGCDVYLSLSEHEGFGLPLIEAMRAGLPVVAYDGAAVGETMGGAGVLVHTLDPPTVAEVTGRVTADATLREALLRRQEMRVADLDRIDRDAAHLSWIRGAEGSWS